MSKKSEETLSSAAAANILRARKAIKMSQHRLAEASGLSRSTIAQIENGRYNSLSLATLEAISRAVQVPEVELLRRTGPQPSPSARAFEVSAWKDAMKPSVTEMAILSRALGVIWPNEKVDPETTAELLRVLRRRS